MEYLFKSFIHNWRAGYNEASNRMRPVDHSLLTRDLVVTVTTLRAGRSGV